MGAPSSVPCPIISAVDTMMDEGEDIPDERSKSSMMTLLPDVGYFADTPRATSGSLSSAFSSCFRPSALTVRLEDGLPLVWNGRSVSSGSESLKDL